MKVFISWSGPSSHAVAKALAQWLKAIDPSLEPFESSREISKGSIWFAELTASLRESAFGIIVLTPENPNSPWINYEAGALFHGLSEARVIPFLLGMESDALAEGPLAMFQAVTPDSTQVLDMARQLNALLPCPRADHLLVKRFDKSWPALEEVLSQAATQLRVDVPPAPPTDLVTFARSQRELDGRLHGVFDIVDSATTLRVAGGTFKTFCDDSRILAALKRMLDCGSSTKILMLHPEGEAIGMLARMRMDYSPRASEERLKIEIEMSLERLLDVLGPDAVRQMVRMSDALPRYGMCMSERLALLTLYLHGHGASSPSFSLRVNDPQTREFCTALAAGFDEAWSSTLSHVPDWI